ncbi:MAG: tetratricopeptide repeat protein [Cyclobacteriaceae bacterium]
MTLSYSVSSQSLTAKVDSLSTLLAQESHDTLAIRHHFAFYEAVKKSQPDEAKIHLDVGMRLATQGEYRKFLLQGYELLGFYWLDRGQPDSVMTTVNKARSLRKVSANQEATFLLQEGRALDGKGQYHNAVEKLLESLALSEAVGDGEAVANTYGNIGNVFWRMGNLDKTAEYYQKGLDVARENDLKVKSAHLLANLGMVAKANGDFDKALDAYFKSLEINRSLDNKNDEAIDLMNIGVLYMHDRVNELKKAKHYLAASKRLSYEVNDKVLITLSTINLAVVEGKSGNYSKELMLLDTAKKLALALNYKPALKEIFNSYSFAYGKLGNYKAALENQKLYESWKDSINNENYTNKISELEIKYESEKSKNEVLALSEENLKKEAMLTKQSGLIKLLIGSGVVVLTIALFGFYIFKQKAKYAEQETLFKAIAQAEITEQRRIAQDLHDSIGSMLATIGNQLSGLDGNINPALLQKSTALVNQTSDEVRRIAHNMMPEELMKFGLVSALQSLVDNLASLNFQVEFIHYGMTTRIEPTKEIHIFRIVQELIQNVTKHAKARKIIVNLTRQENQLNVMIQDDGLGFDNNKSTNGMGIAGIKSRMAYLKGKFAIDSFPNQGSTVILDIPL